jgi:hypothetical protein
LYVNIDITIVSPNQYNNQLIVVVVVINDPPSTAPPLSRVVVVVVAHDPDDAWYIIINPVPMKNGDNISNESDPGVECILNATNANKANAGNNNNRYRETKTETNPIIAESKY